MPMDPARGQPHITWPAAGEIHVWRADLHSADPCHESLRHLLSEDERARAERFKLELARRRFIRCRGILRLILARYTDMPARAVRFGYQPRGKPFLAGASQQPPLGFNVSHAQDLALYAIAGNLDVGIDVEFVRYDLECGELAASVFSDQERSVLQHLPLHRRAEAFFAGWTRKEAFLKARGDGLSARLAGLSVSLDPWGPARVLCLDDDPSAAADWSLSGWWPTPHAIGAVALRGPIEAITCFDAACVLPSTGEMPAPASTCSPFDPAMAERRRLQGIEPAAPPVGKELSEHGSR